MKPSMLIPNRVIIRSTKNPMGEKAKAKARMLAKSLEEAGDASVAMHKKTWEINRKIKEATS